MKKLSLFVLMLMLSVALIACSDGDEEATSNAEEGEGEPDSYKIGAIYSKTGPNNPLGEPEWNATELIVDEINDNDGIDGVPLEVILADDESSQEKAGQETNRLIHDEDVLTILGSSGSTESMAMKGIAEQEEVPMVSAAASIQVVEPIEESEWTFKTPQSDQHAVEKIYVHMQEEGIEEIGLLTDSNAYGESGLEQLEAYADDYDIDIVEKEVFNTEDPDMSTQLTNINSSDAEALITWGTNPGPATIAVNMKDLDMEIPHYSSHGVANQAFIDLAGDAADDVIIPTGRMLFPSQLPEDDPHYDVTNEFYDSYTAEYDSEPTNFGSYGYDNLHLVIDALEAGNTDRESIRDYLENDVNDYIGTTGTFNMTAEDHNGLTEDSLVMATVEDGEWKFFE